MARNVAGKRSALKDCKNHKKGFVLNAGDGRVKLLDLYFRMYLQFEKCFGGRGHTEGGKNSLQNLISNPGQRR